ncbi:M28 family peptidase [Euzebyella saccharophila]|uniref:Vacuolar membrane protease n=1 Tax=Euzebyella saccharophila TaxID=679664 RepID=A0ABV8JNU3_9FLAO|nr:M28 family peptidase [Euzebyella saccharophila]
MHRFPSYLVLIFLTAAIFIGFYVSTPSIELEDKTPENVFSLKNALENVKQMSKKPHATGFPAHKDVQKYLVEELRSLGLSPEVQSGYSLGKGRNLTKATNIMAKIKGREKGKALLLLSHYDSNPHSSLGASDAASGVATILEGIRAFLSKNTTPRNDIIVLFTDAEELGLNGASLFVDEHPWAKQIGLALNFEARGSGGPSYAFIETNRGNKNLLQEFIKANPKYPVANSLYYSIYKMLPNDTDLTVFRENRDIDGFNFAFIDDHFDYHTAQDSYERLDHKSLAHQGSYLMPLLEHFSEADITQLKSLTDYVYFNIPFFEVVSYPFDWIWPILVIALVFFVLILARGIKKGTIALKGILQGFLPLFIVLILNGIVAYAVWPFLKTIYPSYENILHGFTYNGHAYIWSVVFFAIATCIFTYNRFKKISIANLIVAPLFLWILICVAIANYLPGASFFVIPVYALLAMWFVCVNQKEPSIWPLLFLSLPAIWLYSPFISGFAIGLGLKMLVASALLLSLTFVLILPIFSRIGFPKSWAQVFFVFSIAGMVYAHIQTEYTTENRFPNSLVFIQDDNANKSYWASYDAVLSDWNESYFKGKELETSPITNIISSKYNTLLRHYSNAPTISVKSPFVETSLDSIINGNRHLTLCIAPNRPINRIEVYTNIIPLTKAKINGLPISPYDLLDRASGKLLTHFYSPGDYTEIELVYPENEKLQLTILEASNDLLENPKLNIKKRPENNMPMPFVLNDAVLTLNTFLYD